MVCLCANSPLRYVASDGRRHLETNYGSHIFTNLDWLEVYPVETISNSYFDSTFYHLTKEKAATGEKIYAKGADGGIYYSVEQLARYDSKVNKKHSIQALKTGLSMLSDLSYFASAAGGFAKNGMKGLLNSSLSGLMPGNKIEGLNTAVSTIDIFANDDSINKKAGNIFKSFAPFKGTYENYQKLSQYEEFTR